MMILPEALVPPLFQVTAGAVSYLYFSNAGQKGEIGIRNNQESKLLLFASDVGPYSRLKNQELSQPNGCAPISRIAASWNLVGLNSFSAATVDLSLSLIDSGFSI
jgi:hypothetical protein